MRSTFACRGSESRFEIGKKKIEKMDALASHSEISTAGLYNKVRDRPEVSLSMTSKNYDDIPVVGVWAFLTPTEARTVAQAILSAADKAEQRGREEVANESRKVVPEESA